MPADIKYFSGALFWITLMGSISAKLAQSKTNFSTPYCSALFITSSKLCLKDSCVKLQAMSINPAIFNFYQLQ